MYNEKVYWAQSQSLVLISALFSITLSVSKFLQPESITAFLHWKIVTHFLGGKNK